MALVLPKTCLKGRYGTSTKFNALRCFPFALRGFAWKTGRGAPHSTGHAKPTLPAALGQDARIMSQETLYWH